MNRKIIWKLSLLLTLLLNASCSSTDPQFKMPLIQSARPELSRALSNGTYHNRFDSLDQVFEAVYSFPYKSDKDNYGRSDYWASFDEFVSRGGDCEDYAIAAATVIMASKLYTKRQLDFVLVEHKETAETHMILVVDKKYVLDNRFDKVLNIADQRLSVYKGLGVIK